MKAWGEGKLREYLALNLAKLDAAEAQVCALEPSLQPSHKP